MTDYTKDNIEYHSTLSPDAWRGDEMIPEVRMHLLKIALFFAKSINIPNFAVKDIVLSGSMANYNYTRFSDFDIHLVTDYKDLKCDDLVAEFYKAKKTIWNELHDITVNRHEAELYVEDIAEPPVSGGVYSLYDGTWLRQPKHNQPNINRSAVNNKVKDLVVQIDKALESADDHEDVNRIINKLKNMRKSGLEKKGEFSVENLAFKILRNQGYLAKLYDAYLMTQDQELSLIEKLDPQHPNSPPPGPEFKPTMPAGTVRVDVSDVYDWYKLGKNIMDLDNLKQNDFGKGPPSTIVSFGNEPTEHKYIKDLEKLGLSTTDIDPPHRGHERTLKNIKTDPTYNVDGTAYDAIGENFDDGKKPGSVLVKAILEVLPIAQEIWFHGSRAIGKHRPDSDIDILVVVPNDIVGDDYVNAVQTLQKLAKKFHNYDIQPTKAGYNIHRIAQEEGKLLWQTTNENFHDGKKPGRKGLAKRTGVDCKQPISKLRSIAAHSSGERQRMAHWCANMKSGRQK